MTGSGKIYGWHCVLFILLLTGVVSCSKNSSKNLQPDLNAANDLILIHRPVVNIFRVLSMAVTDSVLQQNHIAGIYGSTVIYSPSLNKYMVSYNGSECPDSTVRAGRFYAVLSGPFFTAGTQIIISYNNYSEDYHYMFGTDTITCMGNISGHYTYSYIQRDDSISKDSGRMILFSINETIDLAGDIQSGQGGFSLTGQVNGTSSDGFPFTANISTPFTVSYQCPWISTGEMNLVIPGVDVPDGLISFPSGTGCSDRVNYNFDGIVYQWRMLEGYLEK